MAAFQLDPACRQFVRKSAQNSLQARSWRDIPQQVRPRAMSRGGRRRMWLTVGRMAGATVLVAVLAGAVFVFTDFFREQPRRISSAVNAVPVKATVLRTDGVLDQAWLQRTLALPKQASLMDLDLQQLRTRLLQDPQVITATLTRQFPSTLEVSITERSPVALVNAQIGQQAPQALLVARDGVVFAGHGFTRAVLAQLPFLDGVKLMRADGRFLPIPGMDRVADLLALARNEAPQLYQTWRVVSLAKLDREGEILVHATNVEQIIFSTRAPDDFLHQLAQLDVLIDTTQARTDQPIKEIDLAVGRMSDGRIQVPVTFETPPPGDPAAGAAPDRPALAPPLFHPSRSRKTDREL